MTNKNFNGISLTFWTASLNWLYIYSVLPQFYHATVTTLKIPIISIALSMVVGLICSLILSNRIFISRSQNKMQNLTISLFQASNKSRKMVWYALGVFSDKPPFGYWDAQSKNQDFDVDIAKHVAKDLLGDENKVEFVLTMNDFV